MVLLLLLLLLMLLLKLELGEFKFLFVDGLVLDRLTLNLLTLLFELPHDILKFLDSVLAGSKLLLLQLVVMLHLVLIFALKGCVLL